MFYGFTESEAGTILEAWEQGRIQAEKDVIRIMFHFAENGVPGFGSRAWEVNDAVKLTVGSILKGDYAKAQRQFNLFIKTAPRHFRLEVLGM